MSDLGTECNYYASHTYTNTYVYICIYDRMDTDKQEPWEVTETQSQRGIKKQLSQENRMHSQLSKE